MGARQVKDTIKEEIAADMERVGSHAWDHHRVIAETVSRLYPFTGLDLKEIVTEYVRTKTNEIASTKSYKRVRRYEATWADGRRINKETGQMTLLDYQANFEMRQENDKASAFETNWRRAILKLAKARIGDRDSATTQIDELVSEEERLAIRREMAV